MFLKKSSLKRRLEKRIPRLVEGIVAEHLIRKFGKIFYYYQKKEVDFCIQDVGIEVKWQKKVGKMDFSKTELKNKILLSKDQFEFFGNEAIIPVSIFLLLL